MFLTNRKSAELEVLQASKVLQVPEVFRVEKNVLQTQTLSTPNFKYL